MADNDLTDEQIRLMERKLLGYEPAPQTVVEVRHRRIPKATAKPKPHVEVKPRFELLDWVYDFHVVSEIGRHIVHRGLYSDEAREKIKEYQRDGSEVRVVK